MDEETKLVIGNNNKIREYVTIHPGTSGGGGTTKIGDNCLFMISTHIAHDCNVGNNVIIANNLTVQGTASFQNSENLLIKDRFILLASGSTSARRWWYCNSTRNTGLW